MPYAEMYYQDLGVKVKNILWVITAVVFLAHTDTGAHFDKSFPN